jgi:hypothetical protein
MITDLETIRLRNNARAEKSRRKRGMKPRVYAGPTKVCPACKVEKDRKIDYFQTMRNGKMVAIGYCKVCCSERQRTRDWTKRLVEQVRSRHAKRWDDECDLTAEHLHVLFEQQNGKCAWFRVALRTEMGGSFHHPNQVSLDRIDVQRGYTKDNVLLVCQAANLARCDAPIEVFEDFVMAIRRT